jgi:apolipoprotein N-acyltransferase
MRRVGVAPGAAAVALGAGVVYALSQGPAPHGLLQLASLAALCALILWGPTRGLRQGASSPTQGVSPFQGFLLGGLFGLSSFSLGLSWLHTSMHDIGGMPYVLAALAVLLFAAYLALYPALALALTCWVMRGKPCSVLSGALALACSWLITEVARGAVFTGFPWLAVGYGQVDGPLAGVAALIGVHGLGALTVFLAALAAVGLAPGQSPKQRVVPLLLGIALILLAWPIGPRHWVTPHGPALSVRLLQGNVPQDLKFDPHRAQQAMHDYLIGFEQSRAQLTVLPETAWTVPWSMTPPEWSERLLQQVGRGHAVAIGLPRWRKETPDAPPQPANSVLLLAPHATDALRAPVYDKHHLVPFGEFIPPGFGWFVRMMQIPLGDFARGKVVQAPFELASQRIAFNICYEDLFGEEIRQAVLRADASILANVSNLGWFGRSHALDQHLAIARLRSLETGRPMLRATNTGMTALVDAQGEVIARLEPHVQQALDVTVQGTRGLTPYVRWGHGPALALATIALAWMAWRRRRSP